MEESESEDLHERMKCSHLPGEKATLPGEGVVGGGQAPRSFKSLYHPD